MTERPVSEESVCQTCGNEQYNYNAPTAPHEEIYGHPFVPKGEQADTCDGIDGHCQLARGHDGSHLYSSGVALQRLGVTARNIGLNLPETPEAAGESRAEGWARVVLQSALRPGALWHDYGEDGSPPEDEVMIDGYVSISALAMSIAQRDAGIRAEEAARTRSLVEAARALRGTWTRPMDGSFATVARTNTAVSEHIAAIVAAVAALDSSTQEATNG